MLMSSNGMIWRQAFDVRDCSLRYGARRPSSRTRWRLASLSPCSSSQALMPEVTMMLARSHGWHSCMEGPASCSSWLHSGACEPIRSLKRFIATFANNWLYVHPISIANECRQPARTKNLKQKVRATSAGSAVPSSTSTWMGSGRCSMTVSSDVPANKSRMSSDVSSASGCLPARLIV